ncbi:MAG: peptidase M48 [Leptothrix sp. (in: Bacteria)]|nr:peptidase M48 [Leptothrix sp. (in: b-proteobacteria)]
MIDDDTPSHAAYACACSLHGRRRLGALLVAGALAPAATLAQTEIPECRRSRAASVVPANQVEGSAQQQYLQLLRQAKGEGNLTPATHPQMQRLRYIAQRIVPFAAECNGRAAQWRWEVNLLDSKQINAFCMPGGKIAFYSGILQQLQLGDDEVAVIMGHEVAHALLEHARERMAKSGGTELVLRGAAAIFGLGSLGDIAAQGATQLLSLKFGRSDESEADALGLLLAARAGYDPGAGITLWQKMGAATAGKAPPQWLSTHPAGETRIRDIQAKLPRVQPMFQAAAKPDRRFKPPAG